MTLSEFQPNTSTATVHSHKRYSYSTGQTLKCERRPDGARRCPDGVRTVPDRPDGF